MRGYGKSGCADLVWLGVVECGWMVGGGWWVDYCTKNKAER